MLKPDIPYDISEPEKTDKPSKTDETEKPEKPKKPQKPSSPEEMPEEDPEEKPGESSMIIRKYTYESLLTLLNNDKKKGRRNVCHCMLCSSSSMSKNENKR